MQNGAKCPANRTMRTPDLSHRPLSPAGGSKTVPGRLRKEGTRRGTAKKISLPQRIALFPHIGTCLPVGLLRQDPVVRLKMELEECPQYLHTYRLFSSPS